jgi:hypothetical protein
LLEAEQQRRLSLSEVFPEPLAEEAEPEVEDTLEDVLFEVVELELDHLM